MHPDTKRADERTSSKLVGKLRRIADSAFTLSGSPLIQDDPLANQTPQGFRAAERSSLFDNGQSKRFVGLVLLVFVRWPFVRLSADAGSEVKPLAPEHTAGVCRPAFKRAPERDVGCKRQKQRLINSASQGAKSSRRQSCGEESQESRPINLASQDSDLMRRVSDRESLF